MPKSCEAVFCSSHNQQKVKVSLFKFPSRKKSPERRDKWLIALKKLRKDGSRWSPGKYAVLCGKHFVTGEPNKDPEHPDYVPSIFEYKQQSAVKGKTNLNRYQRKNSLAKRRRLAFSEQQENDVSVVENESDMLPLLAEETLSSEASLCETNDTDHCETKVQNQTDYQDLKKEMSQMKTELNFLRDERNEALLQNVKLQTKLKDVRLSAAMIEGNDKKCQYFTGLSWEYFQRTFKHVKKFTPHALTKDSLSYIDQFFLTLVRLRLDLSFTFLAYQTAVSESAIRNYFWRWIDIIYAKLDFMLKWPSRENIISNLPPAFKAKFPRLTCIVDCFEIFIEKPLNLHTRSLVWSNYKKHTTVKVFIACTPLGAVCFLAPAWGGRVSDVELVRSCGFISPKLHMPGDQILADRGFLLHDDFATVCSAELITPAFTKGKSQLSAQEVEKSREMSSIRIHIERVIGLLKNRFTILQKTIPVTMLKSRKDEAEGEDFASIDRLIRVCGILANLGDSIVVK